MKVFRSLRKKLLSQGKVRKYMQYAIGEILLVMIGILLAVQINKCTNQANLNTDRIASYENVKRQLLEDTNLIAGNIDYNQRYRNQYKYAIDIIERQDTLLVDSLAKISMNLTKYSDFHSDNSMYKTLVNNGEIKLLTNKEILLDLQRLDEVYVYINQLEQTHFDVIKLYIIPQLQKSIKTITQVAINPESLYKTEFQNNFVMMLSLMEEKDGIYQEALNKITAIVKSIDEEVNKN